MAADSGPTDAQIHAESALSANVPGSALPPGLAKEGLWNRHMVALFLSAIHEMISVGITKEDRFDSILSRMLVVVEEKHTSDISAVQDLIKKQFNPDAKGPPA
jgi:hypothetical protein